MTKARTASLIILSTALLVGLFVYRTQNEDSRFNLKLGLDLSGGTHLVYEADVSQVPEGEVSERMTALKGVIETRIDAFGVSEPLVQVEEGESPRLIVELPGVPDAEEAKELIGKTPTLEFKLPVEGFGFSGITDPSQVTDDMFVDTGLSGRFVSRARVEFSSAGGQGGFGLNQPVVVVNFNDEGAELFRQITFQNIGRPLAIFLDGNLISAPVIREEIPGGTAQISGNFTPEEARELVRDLNLGALPVPIELLTAQSVGPTLGQRVLDAGVRAGIVGVALVALFMILWYRLPGLVASLALLIYLLLMFAVFKLFGVTLSAAGIAGFVLSVGMAVDANILIFERTKDELNKNRPLEEAVREGFSRAWPSIRDGNISTLITAIVLFYATTSLVKGFALILGIGVILSMITAIMISRTFLLSLVMKDPSAGYLKLFRAGMPKQNN